MTSFSSNVSCESLEQQIAEDYSKTLFIKIPDETYSNHRHQIEAEGSWIRRQTTDGVLIEGK